MTRGPLPKILMLKELVSKVTLKITIHRAGTKIKEIRPQIVTKEFRTRIETKTNHPRPQADSWIQISLLHINLQLKIILVVMDKTGSLDLDQDRGKRTL